MKVKDRQWFNFDVQNQKMLTQARDLVSDLRARALSCGDTPTAALLSPALVNLETCCVTGIVRYVNPKEPA